MDSFLTAFSFCLFLDTNYGSSLLDWKQLQGKIKAKWGKLTDDDLMHIGGKKDELVGKLQTHYGHSKEEAEKHIDEFVSKI